MNITKAYRFEQTATYLIYKVGRLLRWQAARFFSDHDIPLSPEQWEVLLRIAHEGEQPIGNLVDKELLDYPNVTRLVDYLVKQKMVVKVQSPADRRSYLVSATKDGARLVEEVLPELIEEKYECFMGMDEVEVGMLIATLKKLETNLVGE